MPHECTTCGRTFPDGSKEMLSGCPDCGGNKFQFTPSRDRSSGASASAGESGSPSPDSETADTDPDATAESNRSARSAAKRTGARATETVREWVTRKSDEDDDTGDARTDSQPSDSAPTDSARTGDAADSTPDSAGEPADPASTGTDRQLDTSGFPEWPDSARRPEDRTTAQPDTTADSQSTPADSSDAGSSERGDPSRRAPVADSENSAQADARTGVVSENDIPSGTVEGDATPPRHEDQSPSRRSPRDRADSDDHHSRGETPAGHERGATEAVDSEEGRVVSEPAGDQPSIEQLREELNEQFESIKIVRPGEYELNLMELYNREEYIISLQEDGRYVIEVPDAWRDGDE